MKLQLLPALLFMILSVSCSSAQSVPFAKNPVVRTTPVQVGERAPEFTLEDQQRKQTALASEVGKRATILVFYRGSW